MTEHLIPYKANRILNIILIGLLLILVRVWYLAVVQHDDRLLQARKPQRRTVIEHVERATIRDRFNLPLALNQVQYNAAVCYAHIRQIPSVSWKRNALGKMVKVQERAEYIKKLSCFLGKALEMDPVAIEDIIHGKASLFPHTPFVVREDISEEHYYRLRMMEKDWLGIQMQRSFKRCYPQGKVGADLIGYMGAISQNKYFEIAQEIAKLQDYVTQRENGETPFLPKGYHSPLEVRERLKQLQEKAYTINDLVGIAGIESSFDSYLRGFYGKKMYEVDIQGNFLRELPGSKKAISGRRVLLSVSAELQEYAEKLLIENEVFRDLKDKDGLSSLSQPWIKGGAIVAMDPRTGEVLALASYPRFDPNDFIPSRDPETRKNKQAAILRWLETDSYIGDIWDGKRPLERERYSSEEKQFFDETLPISWDVYLDLTLPARSTIRALMDRISTLEIALELQETARKLAEISGCAEMSTLLEQLPRLRQTHPIECAKLDNYLSDLSHLEDKLLVLDLCRLAADADRFSSALCASAGHFSLNAYRSHCQASASLQSLLRTEMQELFHDMTFSYWRENHFKSFLKQKRQEEKEQKSYARPYTEYLDSLEREMFQYFWNTYQQTFLETLITGVISFDEADPELQPYFAYLQDMHRSAAAQDTRIQLLKHTLESLPQTLRIEYLSSLRCFEELNQPLWGHYRSLRNKKGEQLQKHLASAFYPPYGYGYSRSQAYRQSTPQGSVFKLITTYAGLKERLESLKQPLAQLELLNPFTLIDDLKMDRINTNSQILGYTLDGQPITRLYKGGRLPRSSHSGIGKVDIIGALEQSSNIYFAILAGEHMSDPRQLTETARLFGMGERTGIELPGEIPGKVPDDVAQDRTGLYSLSIGQHSLIVTPLQSATMLATFANGGELLKPKIIQLLAGKEPVREEEDFLLASQYPYLEDLERIGVFFPLFTEALVKEHKSVILSAPTKIRRHIPLPKEILSILMEGMRRTVSGTRGTARPSAIRALHENPEGAKTYAEMSSQLIAKTGTAQILYKQAIDSESKAEMKNHVWFAGISFTGAKQPFSDDWSDAELVVVVYLPYGTKGGREAAPLAAQMVKKWREICSKHGKTSYILREPSSASK